MDNEKDIIDMTENKANVGKQSAIDRRESWEERKWRALGYILVKSTQMTDFSKGSGWRRSVMADYEEEVRGDKKEGD